MGGAREGMMNELRFVSKIDGSKFYEQDCEGVKFEKRNGKP